MQRAILHHRLSSLTRPAYHLTRIFQGFAQQELIGSFLLFGAAFLTLIWANVPQKISYDAFWHTQLTLPLLSLPLRDWISEGLMTGFFLMVGLEIKRELAIGELTSRKSAALPILSAIGGAIVPALIYAKLNPILPAARGWGIPMATDIAFTLGILTLLGKRVPPSLRIFLATLAITDDVIAVLVIALFYASHLSWANLVVAGAATILLIWLNRRGVQTSGPYIALGFLLWASLIGSGIHPTISGIILALTIPASHPALERPLLERFMLWLDPWVTFGIVPLFALANAGIPLNENLDQAFNSPITQGIILGLILGKQIGIMGTAWLTGKLHLTTFPRGLSWRHLYATSWLAGIGFTAALFIANLAFNNSPIKLQQAKAGIIVVSLIAGTIGCLLTRRAIEVKDRNHG